MIILEVGSYLYVNSHLNNCWNNFVRNCQCDKAQCYVGCKVWYKLHYKLSLYINFFGAILTWNKFQMMPCWGAQRVFVCVCSFTCMQTIKFQPRCTLTKLIVVMFTSHHNFFIWEEDEPNPQKITTNNLPCKQTCKWFVKVVKMGFLYVVFGLCSFWWNKEL